MTTPPTPRRADSGDRILANLNRAALAVNDRRRFVLSDAQYADILARRDKRQPWTAIAAALGVAPSTLANAIARHKAAQRKAQR